MFPAASRCRRRKGCRRRPRQAVSQTPCGQIRPLRQRAEREPFRGLHRRAAGSLASLRRREGARETTVEPVPDVANPSPSGSSRERDHLQLRAAELPGVGWRRGGTARRPRLGASPPRTTSRRGRRRPRLFDPHPGRHAAAGEPDRLAVRAAAEPVSVRGRRGAHLLDRVWLDRQPAQSRPTRSIAAPTGVRPCRRSARSSSLSSERSAA